MALKNNKDKDKSLPSRRGKEFWESHYASNTLPWDLGEPSPPFVQLMKTQGANFPPGKMAVPGSGQGHEAGFFGQLGFQVVGFDYVPQATALAKEHYGTVAQFECLDIFHIPTIYHGTFDYVLEHTCLCALRPNLRQAYVALIHRLLKPGGQLIGLFFAHQETGGPPYSITKEEILDLFSPPDFNRHSLERTLDSHPSRQGLEYLGVFTRK